MWRCLPTTLILHLGHFKYELVEQTSVISTCKSYVRFRTYYEIVAVLEMESTIYQKPVGTVTLERFK
jgi:hypothetical protein